ncbi:restriction endonuclease subunit S [Paracidovorax wautersii]|nr:restriction endonuclease subunit S [Paracidovorax wautersii]
MNKTAPLVAHETRFRMIRTTNVRHGRIDLSECRYVEEDTYEKWTRRANLQPGDVILTREAPIGEVGMVKEAEGVFLGQRLMQYRANPKLLDSRFLLYTFLSPALQHQFGSHEGSGSVVSHIRVGDCFKFKLSLPPIGTQREIASTLGALDDRITLLRETNATLEAIAQALFKSWFVDFDPVRAKMAGRAPEGMAEATAALFPDALEETSWGLVPKGWQLGQLDDLLVLQRGFDLPAQDRTEGAYPIIAASGPSGTHREAMVKGPGVVTGRSGVLGRVFLTFDDYWPLNTTLWIKEFRAATACYAYELLRLLDFKSFNAGSAVPTLNRNHIHGLPYVIPERACVEAFESIARPLHERVKSNETHAQSLADLRDTLLPRLISGQLCLPEAQSQLEEALA